MKKLNSISERIFNLLIKGLKSGKQVKLNNSKNLFMPVIVKKIKSFMISSFDKPAFAELFSIAHVRPGDHKEIEMQFLKIKGQGIFPVSMKDDDYMQEAIFFNGHRWQYRKLTLEELVNFSNYWMGLIFKQQNLKLKEREASHV